MPIISLASEQGFADLNAEPDARSKLEWAANNYNVYPIASANMFLGNHRILYGEIQRSLYVPQKLSTHKGQDAILRHDNRILLSLISLHDFAQVCHGIKGEYKNRDGKYRLDLCPPKETFCGLTVANDIDIKDSDKVTTWEHGRGIADVLPVYDPLGRLLEEAGSFKEAAIAVSRICLSQLACLFNPSKKKHEDIYNFIRKNMLRLSDSKELAGVVNKRRAAKQNGWLKSYYDESSDESWHSALDEIEESSDESWHSASEANKRE